MSSLSVECKFCMGTLKLEFSLPVAGRFEAPYLMQCYLGRAAQLFLPNDISFDFCFITLFKITRNNFGIKVRLLFND